MIIKNKIRIVWLLFFVCFLSSCSMNSMMFPPDLSGQEPYKSYVGKTVYLKSGEPIWIGGGGYDDYPHQISPFDPQGSGTLQEIVLKKGQPFYLEKVRHRVGAGVSVVELLGSVKTGGEEYKVSVSGGNYDYRYETELPFTERRP